jgi:hypothetical protein
MAGILPAIFIYKVKEAAGRCLDSRRDGGVTVYN